MITYPKPKKKKYKPYVPDYVFVPVWHETPTCPAYQIGMKLIPNPNKLKEK